MRKNFNKLLLASVTTLLLANLANAQTTICYKNNWDKPSTIENTTLDGGECLGKYSIKDMKEKGWNILDIKVETKQNSFNYTYVLSDEKNSEKIASSLEQNTNLTETSNNFSIKPIGAKIENINDNKSTINIGNLIVGQSGIVVHIYEDSKRMIVSNAKVVKSNEKESIVEFFEFADLKQDAIPTSNRKVAIDDILVLNYMYPASLLIAPNQDTFQIVRSNFKYNNFIHSDIFASKLKNESQPYPTKEDIQKFAIEQNLGTIFIVAENKVNILDTKTFTILNSYPISYEEKDVVMPFYTRVEEINESPLSWSIPFFGNDKSLSYNKYYQKILGQN